MTNSTAQNATDPPRADDQLSLRFFAVINGYSSTPPDRALMRELLDCALRTVRRFVVGAKSVSADAVHHVGLALYCRADRAGIVEGFAVKVIAADTRLTERTVRLALTVLRRLLVFRSTRDGRRKPATHRINIGGLDWPAVRERARAVPKTAPAPRAVLRTALSEGTRTALKGYQVRARRSRSCQRNEARIPARLEDRARPRPGVRHRLRVPAGRRGSVSRLPGDGQPRGGVLAVRYSLGRGAPPSATRCRAGIPRRWRLQRPAVGGLQRGRRLMPGPGDDRDNAALVAFLQALALAVVKLDKPTAARFLRDFDLCADVVTGELERGGADVADGMRLLRGNLAIALRTARRAADKSTGGPH